MRGALGRRHGGLAVITPLPPARTGVATYSARLLEAMAAHSEVRAYADGGAAPAALGNVPVRPLAALGRRERRRLYVFGNSPFHTGALRSIARLGGDALLHEVALWGVYVGLEREGVLEPGGARARVAAIEGTTLEEAMERPCAMVAEVVARAGRILVHTDDARRELAARHPEREADLRVVSFGLPEPDPAPVPQGAPVVASFGHQRAAELVVAAFEPIARAVPDARLWLVGDELFPGQMAPLLARLEHVGLGGRAEATGWLDAPRYRERLSRTAVAVQPRLRGYGERSAALGDLLRAGVPVVTNDGAHVDGIGDAALARIPAGAGADELAAATLALLADAPRRAAMREAALAYAAAHGFERAALDVLAALAR